jgi:hypothetical protein
MSVPCVSDQRLMQDIHQLREHANDLRACIKLDVRPSNYLIKEIEATLNRVAFRLEKDYARKNPPQELSVPAGGISPASTPSPTIQATPTDAPCLVEQSEKV